MVWATPVHCWTADALTHLFVERLYPFLWSGKLKGMPSVTISCASNQGMQYLARRELCKYMFGMRTLYLGGVAGHVAQFDSALKSAHVFGLSMGDAALADARGRNAWSDEDAFEHYNWIDIWDPLEAYVENMCGPRMDPEDTIMHEALREGTIRKPDAVEEVKKAQAGFAEALRLKDAGDFEEASRAMARATAHWTSATWTEFLEDEVIGVEKPEAYRPTDDEGD